MPRHVLSNRIPPLIAIASGNATAAAVMPVVPAYIFHRRDTRHVVLIGECIAVAEAVRILRDGNYGYGLMIFTVWAKAAIAIELGLERNTAPDSKRPVLPILPDSPARRELRGTFPWDHLSICRFPGNWLQ